MAIADPEAALRILREFHQLNAQAASGSDDVYHAINHLSLLVNDIADALGMPGVDVTTYDHDAIIDEMDRLIGKLERQDDYLRIFGPVGPTLAADRLHPWVWGAAANLWDDGHYVAAVEAAFKKMELQAQKKLRASKRRSGSDLFAQAFSPEDPKPDSPRLRFPDIDRAEAEETWNSAHEGAKHLGMGCAKGIRNPLAHPTEDTSEIGEDEKQEALEQLAALSVLARWVDACEVDRAESGESGRVAG